MVEEVDVEALTVAELRAQARTVGVDYAATTTKPIVREALRRALS
jgi:hypothetical protein